MYGQHKGLAAFSLSYFYTVIGLNSCNRGVMYLITKSYPRESLQAGAKREKKIRWIQTLSQMLQTPPFFFLLCALCFSCVIEPIVLVVTITLLQRVVNRQVQGRVMTDLLW